MPNHTRQLVSLGDIMTSPEAKTATHPLDVAIGKDIAGRSVFLNLATTPHLLIAGTTGAGKSSGINCIITSLLMRTTPDQVRLILIDPKQVEMGQYNRLPHLLTAARHQPEEGGQRARLGGEGDGAALRPAVRGRLPRHHRLQRGVRPRRAAARRHAAGDPDEEPPQFERLPYIVVVVDELNDLMMVAARDVEESITRIAQKARAVGIHLIVATQRPIGQRHHRRHQGQHPGAHGVRRVNSLTDSRVILDQPGAEKLVGKGDMLLLPGNSQRRRSASRARFVSEEEVRKVVAHWRRQAPEVVYVSGVEGDEDEGRWWRPTSVGSGGDDDEDETLMRQAMELVVRSQLGSHVDAAAQAEGRLRPRRADHGPARAARRRRPQRGLEGPCRADDGRGVRAAAAGQQPRWTAR